MAMLATILCSLTLIAPQQPTGGEANAAVPTVARLLPKEALAVLVVDRPADHLSALRQTGLWRLLAANRTPDSAAELFNRITATLEASGIDTEARQSLLQASFAVTWTGISKEGRPGLLFAVDLHGNRIGADYLYDSMRRTIPGGVVEDWNGVEVIATETAGHPSWFVRQGTALMLCTDRDVLAEAIRAASGSTGTAIADHPTFAVEYSDPSVRPFVLLFARPANCAATLVGAMSEFRNQGNGLRTTLQVDRMQLLVASLRVTGDTFVERIRTSWPAPQTGLLAALAGKTGGVDLDAAKLIPPTVQHFAVGKLDWRTLFDEGLSVAAVIEPEARVLAENALQAFREQHGVDPLQDILPFFTGRTLLANWTADDQPEFLLWQEVGEPEAMATAVPTLLAAMGVATEPFDCAGTMARRATSPLGPGIQPLFAVEQNYLVMASSVTALQQALDQIRQPVSDSQIREFLLQAPTDATWASWSRGEADSPVARLGVDGSQQSYLLRDDRGLAIEHRSALGTWGTLSVTLPKFASQAIPQWDLPAVDAMPVIDVVITEPDQPGTDANPLELAALAEAEQAGRNADVEALKMLLTSASPAVVGRACWLLGQMKAVAAASYLCVTAEAHEVDKVRIQAMAALSLMASQDSLDTANELLADPDIKVRTLAATLAGRLRSKSSVSSLLALVAERGVTVGWGEPTDVVAAVLALNDLGNSDLLLPVADAIQFSHHRLGQALAFLFQSHSPKLARKEEVSVLMAVLDHPEPLLRRYAIQRLGELRDPHTAGALEGRLGVETESLQPLVRVALAAVRGDKEVSDDLMERAKANLALLAERVTIKWHSWNQRQQMTVIGMGALGLVAIFGMMLIRRRMRRQRRAEAAAMLATPSAPETQWDEYSDGQAYDAEGAHAEEDPVGSGYGQDNYR